MKVNYLHIIKRFWKMNDEERFTAMEIAVFFAIVELYNQRHSAYEWLEPYAIDNEKIYRLVSMALSTFQIARAGLIRRGVIEYIPGKNRFDKPKYVISIARIIATDIATDNRSLKGVATDIATDIATDNRSLQEITPIYNNKDYIDYIDATNVARNARAREGQQLASSECLTDEQLLNLYFPGGVANRDIEAVCMQWHVTPEQVRSLADAILRDWRMIGQQHLDRQDQRQHFVNLLRKKINELKKNGTTQQLTREERNAAFMQHIYDHINKPKNPGMSELVF